MSHENNAAHAAYLNQLQHAYYDVPVDAYQSYSALMMQLMFVGGFPLVAETTSFQPHVTTVRPGLSSIIGRVSRSYIPLRTGKILRTERSLIALSADSQYLVDYSFVPSSSEIICRFYEGQTVPNAVSNLFEKYKEDAKKLPLGMLYREVKNW